MTQWLFSCCYYVTIHTTNHVPTKHRSHIHSFNVTKNMSSTVHTLTSMHSQSVLSKRPFPFMGTRWPPVRAPARGTVQPDLGLCPGIRQSVGFRTTSCLQGEGSIIVVRELMASELGRQHPAKQRATSGTPVLYTWSSQPLRRA